MALCKFCCKLEAINKSHIIPEFMYKRTYDDKHKMVVLDRQLLELDERQKGYYEPLLCKECEHYFNINFEQTCLHFFNSIPDKVNIGSPIKFQPCKSLDLLILSILWRASHASGEHWQGVTLGHHQEIIKRSLQEKTPNSKYEFWLFISAHPDGTVEKGIVSSVQHLRVSGHNTYHFVAGGIQFVAKISSHAFSDVAPAAINFQKDFCIQSYRFDELPSILTIFKNKRTNRAMPNK